MLFLFSIIKKYQFKAHFTGYNWLINIVDEKSFKKEEPLVLLNIILIDDRSTSVLGLPLLTFYSLHALN